MEKEKVFLGNLEKAVCFIKAAEKSPARMYLKSGLKTVNAKSFLGLASMDLNQTLTLEIIGDEDSLREAKQAIHEFIL